jgi:hypothetical protein
MNQEQWERFTELYRRVIWPLCITSPVYMTATVLILRG